MLSIRELVIGTSLLVALVMATVGPDWRAQPIAAATVDAPGHVSAPVLSGPGFTVCTADETWQRPTAAEQAAHLGGDRRFDGLWESPATTGYREFVASAVLYDGKSADGLHWISNFTGLWKVWEDTATRPKTCWTDQPQVFLFGYEAVAYDAQDPKVAQLRVRPAPGYRMVILTGPIRASIAVFAERKLDELSVPAELVTPAHVASREGP